MKRIKAFTAMSIFELEAVLNTFNENNKVFATQVFQVAATDKVVAHWAALVYHEVTQLGDRYYGGTQ